MNIGGAYPDIIDLVGSSVICPKQVGLFQCTTTNQFQVSWDVDGEPYPLNSNNRRRIGNNGIAYLVERNVESEATGRGNRTSYFTYTPDSSIRKSIVIVCSGGSSAECRNSVLAIGKLQVRL